MTPIPSASSKAEAPRDALSRKAAAAAERRYITTFIAIGRGHPRDKLELLEIRTRVKADDKLMKLLQALIDELNGD